MERLASGLTTKTQTARRPSRVETNPKQPLDKANPRSRRVDRSTRGFEYSAFADAVRRDLNPRGPLESVMADHVIRAAWRLRSTLDREAGRGLDTDPAPALEAPKRPSATAADRAARSVKEAMESLDSVRLIQRLRDVDKVESPPLASDTFPEIAPNEWPIVPESGDEIAEIEPDAPYWRDRLVFDSDVSDTSPVIKGTWITVSHVIALIVDGDTWADILRSHPELSEADIRTCLAYTMAEEDMAG